MFRFIFFIICLLIFCLSSVELQRRFQANTQILIETEPLDQADNLLAQERWEEAKSLSSFIARRSDLGDTQHANRIELDADEALSSLTISGRSFLDGLISGEVNNSSSLVGALALDLFVLGDVRDLVVQGYKVLTDQPSDKIIIALSATGLGLSLLPQLHWAPAVLKSLKRSGALSKSFLKSLARVSNTALKTGDYKPLTSLVTHFAKVTEKLGLARTRGAMKAVKSEADLARLAGAAVIDPKKAYAVSVLAGNRGIKQLNKNGSNILKTAAKIKRMSRAAKFLKKSLGAIPKSILQGAWGLSLLALLSLFIFRKQRKA